METPTQDNQSQDYTTPTNQNNRPPEVAQIQPNINPTNSPNLPIVQPNPANTNRQMHHPQYMGDTPYQHFQQHHMTPIQEMLMNQVPNNYVHGQNVPTPNTWYPPQINYPNPTYLAPSPSHYYDQTVETSESYVDPRSVPLPSTVNTEQKSRPPSVVSVSSTSTMSTKQSSQPVPAPLNHQSHQINSNHQQHLMLQTIMDNQRLIQEMQHKLHALSKENSFLKQQHKTAPPTDMEDNMSVGTSTIATHNQEAFYQQMIEASKAQQAFYQKSDILSSNLKFPKFSGKSTTEFITWYDQVLSILAIPPWQSLYDKSANAVITEELADESLSMKLYSSLKLCIQGQAQSIMNTKTHLRGRGLEYLKTLHTIYRKKLTKVEIINKETEYNSLYRKDEESLDAFAARCLLIHQELKDNGGFVNNDGLRNRFIRGLGPDFSDIQKRLDNLPEAWNTLDIEELLNSARNHLHNILAIRSNNKQHKENTKVKDDKESEDKGGQKKPKPLVKPKKPHQEPTPTPTPHPEPQGFKTRQMNPDIRDSSRKMKTGKPGLKMIWKKEYFHMTNIIQRSNKETVYGTTQSITQVNIVRSSTHSYTNIPTNPKWANVSQSQSIHQPINQHLRVKWTISIYLHWSKPLTI